MELAPVTLWHQCKEELRDRIPAQPFSTWIDPIGFVEWNRSASGSRLTLTVPSDFHREWVDREFGSEIRHAFAHLAGPIASVRYRVVQSDEDEEMELVQENADARSHSSGRRYSGGASGAGPSQSDGPAPLLNTGPSHLDASRRTNSGPERTGIPAQSYSVRPETVPGSVPRTLNERYTFDAFIEADCNRLARSAGLAVADRPGATSFNPFLIYGKVGLGKTHLAHAIGNHIVSNNARVQVLYLTSEAFTNAFVQAIQNNTLSEFTDTFRRIDVLIVDDIQFFGGKEKTQEQFFHLFNDLHHRGKQIILCADRSPAEIAGIEERLLSRFRWGLSADVQPPDLETRIAILQQHSRESGLELSREVIDYIAYNVRDNIRCLEGAFNRLLALQQITRQDIDLQFVREALHDLVDKQTRRSVSATDIRDIVGEHYGLGTDVLIGKSRKRPIVDARQVAMHFCKQMTQLSLEAIGGRFGGRDHSTVIHACKAIQARLDTDPAFCHEMDEIERKLRHRLLHS